MKSPNMNIKRLLYHQRQLPCLWIENGIFCHPALTALACQENQFCSCFHQNQSPEANKIENTNYMASSQFETFYTNIMNAFSMRDKKNVVFGQVM